MIMENIRNVKTLVFVDEKTRWSPKLCEIMLQLSVLNNPNTGVSAAALSHTPY